MLRPMWNVIESLNYYCGSKATKEECNKEPCYVIMCCNCVVTFIYDDIDVLICAWKAA